MQARVCLRVCVHCVCVWVQQRSCAEVAAVVTCRVLARPWTQFTRALVLSLSLGSLSRLNLPLEYPMGPFYKGKFCDRARETTDTATATRKRVTEREREAAHERRTTNENKSEQTKQWTKRLRSLERVEKRQKQGILCCHRRRRGRCCCCLLPACAAFFEFYKSVFHFLFHIIQPFSL